jgi:hypothetical protein
VSLAIFAVGVFVFLITVYGTVVSGGLMLTDRQLDDQPDLVPDHPELDGEDDSRIRRLVETSY